MKFSMKTKLFKDAEPVCLGPMVFLTSRECFEAPVVFMNRHGWGQCGYHHTIMLSYIENKPSPDLLKTGGSK